MYLKMMGPEDLPDSDTRKSYRLVQQVVDARTERHEDGKAFISYTIESGEMFTVPVSGNVYILNDQGKTVSTFGCGDPLERSHRLYERFCKEAQRIHLHGKGSETIIMSEDEFKVMTENNRVDYIPDAAGDKMIPTFLGQRVIVPGTNYSA